MKRLFFIGIILVLAGLGAVWLCSNFAVQPEAAFSANRVGEVNPPVGFTRADGSHVWDFSIDFGPHHNYQTEWWYYTGNLQTLDGRRFGYQLTFFRRGLTPLDELEERDSIWAGNQVYMGHFALSDIAAEEHYEFERFSRGAAGLAGAQAEPFQVWLENWEVVQNAEGEWRLKAEQDGAGLDLLFTDEKGVVFQGIDGYSQKGPEAGNASYYFSQTRLASNGMVEIGGETFLVTGLSWMDHEFSTSVLSDGQVGWDWFSLQLDDGSDLMVFQIRREDGSIDPFSSGTFISPEGKTIHLNRSNFEIQVNDTWQSPDSGGTYPAAWTIQIPQIDIILDIKPYMADQEMNVSYSYWEGAVSVQGTIGGQMVTGSGYVELTGYAASMEGDF